MKVKNMTSARGNKIANQFIIREEGRGALGNFIERKTFQSYQSIIAIVTIWKDGTDTELDINKWDYSVTTGKYRNIFLGETKKETEVKIKSGEYKLADLN
jgi:hypothetical protein|tara:strand:- start:3585 stop:3884 length:300 start_codon:yes stop_codon:yes gene_type:complete